MIETKTSVARQILNTLYLAKLTLPLAILVLALIMTTTAAISLYFQLGSAELWRGLLLTSIPVFVICILLVSYLFIIKLLKPLVMLENSVTRVSSGSPGERVSLEEQGVLKTLVRDIGSINDELFDLYEDMDSRVEHQTRRLAQKTASLKILYDVAAMINQESSLDNLLLRFLRVLKEIADARSATVRITDREGKTRLVGAIGLDNEIRSNGELFPMLLCKCGAVLSAGDILCQNNAVQCSKINSRTMFNENAIEKLKVNLEHHDQLYGEYHLYVDKKSGLSEREDIMDLMKTIGNHLGISVAKHISDEEAQIVKLMEERNSLAHELHDSLAQTLTSLRFQVRMLSDGLQESKEERARSDVIKIRNSVEEANTELRTLITNFRAPVHGVGLGAALNKMAERFQNLSGIKPYLQINTQDMKLDAAEEMQIIRIIQEALVNCRKHAHAKIVRIMLNYTHPLLTVLIEDDGIGFDQAPQGDPGEHIGLDIMYERAMRLGAELKIESEPGEGTRVEMLYTPRYISDQNAKAL